MVNSMRIDKRCDSEVAFFQAVRTKIVWERKKQPYKPVSRVLNRITFTIQLKSRVIPYGQP